jgi:hypothetical protein
MPVFSISLPQSFPSAGHEITVKRERIAGEWQTKEIESDWLWATTMPRSLATAQTIGEFGHDRWKIENEGFNELVTHWHADHYFHHHPNTITVLWLMLFMAHAVSIASTGAISSLSNGAHHTVIYFAGLMAASLQIDNWWPPPT